MTSLKDKIIEQIRLAGPIDVATYMTLAMAHRTHGYYSVRNPLGAAGDFVTAPEISQLFGELIGAALAQTWIDQGSPADIDLIEIGPGRGTFCKDMLRATRNLPGFHQAVTLHLVETSEALISIQRETLAGQQAIWHADILDIKRDVPAIIFANELFDVLPIRQWMRKQEGFFERRIAIDEHGELGFVLDHRCVNNLHGQHTIAAGGILEISPARETMMLRILERLVKTAGTAYIIDYGELELEGADTLQAVTNHHFADLFAEPGEADISSHVDFGSLLRVARSEGLQAFGPVSQSVFLQRLGIKLRLAQLQQFVDDQTFERLSSGAERLIANDQMGDLFKVIAVTSQTSPPPGFIDAERY